MTFCAQSLQNNFRLVRAKVRQTDPGADVWAVVKANAYGHGLARTVRALSEAGAEKFAVADLAEALAVRAVCPRARVLILGVTPPACAGTLAENGLTQTVHTRAYAAALAGELGSHPGTKPLSCALKLDVGMGRLGFDVRTELSDAAATGAVPHLRFDEIFAHLPDADDLRAKRTPIHIAAFHDSVAALRPSPAFRSSRTHLCASAGAFRFGAAGCDGVRCGLALYGYLPGEGLSVAGLMPALSVTARLVQVKYIPAGGTVGYGGTWTATEPTRVGILSIGYRDGFLRALSGARLRALGHPVTVIGRISMDFCAVKLGFVPADVGDEVTVIDRSGKLLPALARHAGTIPYELLCSLGEHA